MKRLFDESYRYTDDANRLDAEVLSALQEIFDRYVADGFLPREVSHLMQLTCIDMELKAVLNVTIPSHRSNFSRRDDDR